jgi:hypothetical protein
MTADLAALDVLRLPRHHSRHARVRRRDRAQHDPRPRRPSGSGPRWQLGTAQAAQPPPGGGSRAGAAPKRAARQSGTARTCPGTRRVAAGLSPLRERENPAICGAFQGTATGIRTPVSAVRGRRPSPLDDGGSGTFRVARARNPTSGRAKARGRYARSSPADVAELVDARRSGRRESNLVEVRVLSSASCRKAPAVGLSSLRRAAQRSDV